VWLGLLFLAASGTASTLEHFTGTAPRTSLVLATLLGLALLLQGGSLALGQRRERRRRAARAALDSPPSVSVVIPARNEQGYLEEAIRSVRRQWIPAEVVVVANGCTDGTAAIANRMAERVVEHAEALGFSRSRNLGAAAAGGEWLVFLDADSRMGPGALEAILSRARPGDFGTVLGRPDRWALGYWFFFKNLWHRLGLYKGALGGLLFCDAELYRRVGGFDEGLGIDEIHVFSQRARASGGRYVLVTDAYAVTSMRRFAATGVWRSFWFWCCLRFRFSSSERFLSWRRDYCAHQHRPLPGAAAEPGSGVVHGRRPVPDLRARAPAEL
jgi:glycosyltransferase involved in cell wall biosynthesis